MDSFTPEQLNKFKLDYDNGMYPDSPVADSIRQKIALQGNNNQQPMQPGQIPERTFGGTVQDIGTTMARGVLGAGESLVGLADIATGGHAGKFLEDKAGYKIGDLSKELSDNYSPTQQALQQKRDASSGFLETLETAVQNPSLITEAVIESIPSMILGGGIGRGLFAAGSRYTPGAIKALEKVSPGLSRIIGGAAGEGTVQAGSMAEQVRGQNEDGLLTGGQILKSIGSGIGTGAFTLIGGRIANKLGFSDADTFLAGGRLAAKSERNVISRIIGGGISEGVFEELPQSMQEQIWMNSATGKPLMDNVGESGAMGMLAGVGMGGGMNVMSRNQAVDSKIKQPPKPVDLPDQLKAINAKIDKVSNLDMSLANAKELKNLYQQANKLKDEIKADPTVAISPKPETKQSLAIQDLDNQIIELNNITDPTVGQVMKLDELETQRAALWNEAKQENDKQFQDEYLKKVIEADDRQQMYNDLFGGIGTAREAAKELKYVPKSGRPTDIITRSGIPYAKREDLETYLKDLPNKDDYEITEVSLQQFTKNLLTANRQKKELLKKQLNNTNNPIERQNIISDIAELNNEIINLTNQQDNLESEAFDTEYPGQVGYVARLTDEAIDNQRQEVIAEREAQEQAEEDQDFINTELTIRRQRDILKLQSKYKQVKNNPDLKPAEKKAILSLLDNVFDSILPKKNKVYEAAKATQAYIDKLNEGTLAPTDQSKLMSALDRLKREYKALAAEEVDPKRSADILTNQKQIVALHKQVKELQKTADLTNRAQVEAKIGIIESSAKPTKKQKIELKKLQNQIKRDDIRQEKIAAINRQMATIFTDTDRTMNRRFRNDFDIQREMGDDTYRTETPETAQNDVVNISASTEVSRPQNEQQVFDQKTLTAASGIDQINQGISGRLANKYADLYTEPTEMDSNLTLPATDYESIVNYQLTPAELDAKIAAHPNKDTYLKDLKTTISQTLGDLEETYRYEGTQDGKAIEDYIDSLLAVIQKYNIPQTTMQDQNSETQVNLETEQIPNNTRVENQPNIQTSAPDQATIPVEDTSAGAVPNLNAIIKAKQAELNQLFKSIPTLPDKEAKAVARQQYLDLSAEIEKLKIQKKESVKKLKDTKHQIAYHATPLDWEPEPGFPHGRPRLDKIFNKETVGEGVWANGAGWYSAESEAVGRSYLSLAAFIPPKVFLNGKPYDGVLAKAIPSYFKAFPKDMKALTDALIKDNKIESSEVESSEVDDFDFDFDIEVDGLDFDEELAYTEPTENEKARAKEAERLAELILSGKMTAKIPGDLYKLDIPDEVIPKLLDFDEKLSQQNKNITNILKANGLYNDLNRTGRDFYNTLTDSFGSDIAASTYLASIGIPGNQYLDGDSRSGSGNTHDYVIWDQAVLDQIVMLEKNDKKIQLSQQQNELTRRDFIKQGIGLVAWSSTGINPATAFASNKGFKAELQNKDQSAEGLLSWISQNSSNPQFQKLAKDLIELLPDANNISVNVSDVEMPSSGTAKVDRKNGKIAINIYGNGQKESTFLHEIIHAVMIARYDMLNYYMANPGKFGVHNADQALEQYNKVWREFRSGIINYAQNNNLKMSDLPLWMAQPYSDPDEFITYALTHPELQKFLSQHEYDGRTLYERFKDVMRKIWEFFSDKKNPTWLDAAMVTSDDLLQAMKLDKPDFKVAAQLLEMSQDTNNLTKEEVEAFREANNIPPMRSNKDGGHPTQREITKASYKKLNDYIIPDHIKAGKILDYGAGKNMGARFAPDLDISSFEPDPMEGFIPTYSKTEDIPSNSFDGIINNAVLNVVPDDTRYAVVKEIGRILKPGGMAFINVRGSDVLGNPKAKTQPMVIPGGQMEVIANGSYAYQKGFTQAELTSYLQSTLGDGFSVTVPKGKMKYAPVVAVVTKKATNKISRLANTNTKEFKQWFGDSQVVDENGKPLVVYHGTGSIITSFDRNNPRMREGKLGKGIYVTPSKKAANLFAKIREQDGASNIMPLYISLQKPFIILGEKNLPVTGIKREALESQGYDGVILKDTNGKIKEIVAYNPNQIKSVFNNGKWNPNDNNISYELADTNNEFAGEQAQETWQNKPQFEVRENNVPGQGMSLKAIQTIYPNQNVVQSADGKVSVYFKNGKGITIQNIQNAGDGYIQFAIDTNQMSKNGKILGITVDDKILLDAAFADKTTLWHENKHVLDNLGMITKEDNSVLTKEFNNLRKAGKLEFELSTHEDPMQRMRENIANTFAQVMTQRENYRTGPLKTFIQKVMDFFNKLFSLGKQTLSGLAQEVESGKIYERTLNGETYQTTVPQTEVAANKFYSQLRKVIDQKFSNGSGEQVKNQVQAWVNKGEFKQAELEWSGLLDWLDGKQSVTKKAVLDYLDANQVHIEEIILPREKKAKEGRILNLETQQLDREINTINNKKTALLAQAEELFQNTPYKINYHSSVGFTLTNPQENNLVYEVDDFPFYLDADLKRNLFAVENQIDSYNIEIEDLVVQKNDLQESYTESTKFDQYQEPGGTNYKEFLFTLPTQEQKYKSSHFDEPNILVHVRMNERIGENGEKVLFLEEVQSDWHQEGREKGYNTKSQHEIKTLFDDVDVALRFDIYDQIEKDALQEVKRRYSELQNKGKITLDEYYSKVDRLADLATTPRSLIEPKLVPDAPFKGSKAWSMLAIKNMVRYAAENGFDSIAWTPGEVQVDRYKKALQKAVDKVEWAKTQKGIQLVGYKNGEQVVNTIEHENSISDALGKSMGDSIIADSNQSGTFEGDDITISDTGMAGFYDKILPSEVNKFFNKKSWGKAKATPTELASGMQAWSFPITPKMKSKALREGMPQFMVASNQTQEADTASYERPQISPEEYLRVFNQKKNLWTRVKQISRMTKADTKLLSNKLFAPISTRLKMVNHKLSAKVRELDYRTGTKIADRLEIVLPLLEKVNKGTNKMSAQDASAWDWARKQGDVKTITQLTNKYDITEHYAKARKMLDQIYKEGIDVGFDMGNIAEYWPRIMKDQEGFLQRTRGISQRPDFTDALQAQASKMGITVEALDPVMRADIISNMILGVHAGIGGPGNTQSRVFDQIPDEYAEFYMDSDAAMMQYIYSMTKRIEARKFFGKVPEKITKAKQKLRADETRLRNYQGLIKTAKETNQPIDQLIKKVQNITDDIGLMNNIIEKYKHQRDFTENIGSYIDELLVNKDIQQSDERNVREILEARFHERGTTGIINAYKNLAYIDTMGSPLSAITQIGDLAWAYYIGGLTPTGIMRTTKNIANAAMNKSNITKEDLGISRIAQEFADSDSLSRAVSKVFKVVGLEQMDSIGKEALINTSWENYKDKARQNPNKLKKEIHHIFGKESGQVVTDLLGGSPTDNVKLLVYNRLLDFQPVALSEMPEKYLNSGNGRIFYMLKTYTMKQFDVFRREVLHNIKYGNREQKIDGIRNMISLTMLLTLANAGADELKDFILGKDTKVSDNVIENLLTMGGASRYTKMQVRNDGLGSAYIQQILPPMKFVNSISKDVSGDVADGLRSVDSIPGVGKLYYWHFGRGADKRPSQLEQEFKDLKRTSNKFKEQIKDQDDKRAFLYANIDQVRTMKKVDHFQGILNKNTTLINKLKDMKQTPNVRKRISQLQQRKEMILKNFFQNQN